MNVPDGIVFREGTCDELVFDEVWVEDVYRMAALPLPQPGQSALDLGANVGAWTLRALDCGVDTVVAVEPMPENVAQLRTNLHTGRALVQQLDTYRVDIVEAAVVANDLDEVTMVASDPKYPSITWRQANWFEGAEADRMVVPSVHIDTLLGKAASWWCMKVDIEGAEYELFRGVDKDLLARVDYIVMEFHGRGMGPHCAWIDEHAFGGLMEALSEWGSVQTLGAASRGGMIYAWRYSVEAPHMWP